ncbi:MAG: hypothetical protein J6U54_04790, partial [Clostridiales bacterium]|nr:hypothetical protein [Clostridiales bacterium]
EDDDDEDDDEREKKNIKYATDCKVDDSKHVKVLNDTYDIWKRDENGTAILQITYRGEEKDPRDYLLFWVFDSSAEAKEKYESLYDRSKNYQGISEEGDNWFISQEPDVCDVGIIWMNYLDGNVIISAELDMWSEWPEYYDEDEEEATPTPTPTEPAFDTYSLKDYILENADDIKAYVLKTILADV